MILGNSDSVFNQNVLVEHGIANHLAQLVNKLLRSTRLTAIEIVFQFLLNSTIRQHK